MKSAGSLRISGNYFARYGLRGAPTSQSPVYLDPSVDVSKFSLVESGNNWSLLSADNVSPKPHVIATGSFKSGPDTFDGWGMQGVLAGAENPAAKIRYISNFAGPYYNWGPDNIEKLVTDTISTMKRTPETLKPFMDNPNWVLNSVADLDPKTRFEIQPSSGLTKLEEFIQTKFGTPHNGLPPSRPDFYRATLVSRAE